MENNSNNVMEPIAGEITSELNPSFEPIEFVEAEIIKDDEDWKDTTPAFIESNSQAITLEELETKCIVPCFATNELTLSHQEIAKNLYSAAALVYGQENLGPLEFRVSHPISGRVGKSALSKDIDQLLDSEKSLWFQRIACCFKVKSMTNTICGQETNLCIGFIRSYHTTNLYSGKSAERISLYCGTRVKLCSNMCLTLSGLRENLQCLTGMDVKEHAHRLLESYSAHADEDTQMLENLSSTFITPSEFSHLIGRLRYYMALSTNEQKALVEGIYTKEIRNQKIAKVDVDVLEIRKRILSYSEEKSRYQKSISDMEGALSWKEKFKTAVSFTLNISDEQEIYKIIHQHIKIVYAEALYIKDKKTAKLTVEYIDGDIEYYLYFMWAKKGMRVYKITKEGFAPPVAFQNIIRNDRNSKDLFEMDINYPAVSKTKKLIEDALKDEKYFKNNFPRLWDNT